MSIRDILFSDENPEFYTPIGNYAPKNFDSVVQDADREFSWEDFHWTLFYVYDKEKEKIVPFEPVYTDAIESVKYPYCDSYRDKRVIRILLEETKKKLEELDTDIYEPLIGKTFHFLVPEKDRSDESEKKIVDGGFVGGKYYWTEIDGKKFLFNDAYKRVEFHGDGFKDIKAYYDGKGEIVCTLGFDGIISIWAILKEYIGNYQYALKPLERIYKSDDIYDISFTDNRREGNGRGRNENALVLVVNGKRKSAIICYDKNDYESKLYADKVVPNSSIHRLAGTCNYFLVKEDNWNNSVYYLNHEKLIRKKDFSSSIPKGEIVVMENLFSNCRGTLIYSFGDKSFYAVDDDINGLIIFKLNPMVVLPIDILGNQGETRKVLYYDEDSNSLSATFRASYTKYYGRKYNPKSYVLGAYKEDGYHPIQEEFDVVVGIYRDGKFHYNKGFPSSAWLSLDSNKKTLMSCGNIIQINKRTFKDLIDGKFPESDYIRRM